MSASSSIPFTVRVVSSGGIVDNPDSVPAGALLWSRDYETEVATDIRWGNPAVPYSPGLVNLVWGASHGYGPSGGWRAQPNPIVDPSNGNNAENAHGWACPYTTAFPGGPHQLIAVSFLLKISQELLDAIDAPNTGTFWDHMNKAIDMGGGGIPRFGAHFGERPPRWQLCAGGAGPYKDTAVDYTPYAGQWVWHCFVIDVRGATPAERCIAMYVKPEGASAVVRIGRMDETEGLPAIGNEIPAFNLTPLWGYWDDMGDRALVEAAGLANMFLYVDRFKITSGWPTGADGPPF